MTPPLLRVSAPARSCPNGHDLTNHANAYTRQRRGGGTLIECRACKRERQRDRDRRLRAVPVAQLAAEPLPVRVVETNDGTWPALPIDQWVARYGRPGIHYAQIENDS